MSYSTVNTGMDPEFVQGVVPKVPMQPVEPIDVQFPMLIIKGKEPNNEMRIAPPMICIEEQLNADDTKLALHLVNGEVLEVERNLDTDELKLLRRFSSAESYNSRYK